MNVKFLLSFFNTDIKSEYFIPEFDDFKRLMPDHFKVTLDNDKIYLEIIEKKNNNLSYEQEVERELDRWFFLNGTKVTAEQIGQRFEKYLHFIIQCSQEIPSNIEKQEWDSVLALQLRLWRMATECNELNFKMLLFYQIIELSNCNFDKYTNPNEPPTEVTECKFLRHLVAHSNLDTNREVKFYLKFLEISGLIDSETFRSFIELGHTGLAQAKLNHILYMKMPMVEKQARLRIKLKYFPSID